MATIWEPEEPIETMMQHNRFNFNPLVRDIFDLYNDIIGSGNFNYEFMNLNNLIGILEMIQRNDLSNESIEILKICANFIICCRFNLEPEPISSVDIIYNLRFFIRIQLELITANNITETNEFLSNQLVNEYIFGTMVPDLEDLLYNIDYHNLIPDNLVEDIISVSFEDEMRRIPGSEELINKVKNSKHIWDAKEDGDKCLICFECLIDNIVITCEKCKNSICSNCINENLKYDHRCPGCRSNLNDTICVNNTKSVELKVSDIIPFVKTKKQKNKDERRNNQKKYKKDRYNMKKNSKNYGNWNKSRKHRC